MKINIVCKHASGWILSLLLCLPMMANGADNTSPKDPAAQHKVQLMSQKATKYPRRGMSMKQVRKQYGSPKKVRVSKGKVKKQWPKITAWEYGPFTVYFERKITLHTVVH